MRKDVLHNIHAKFGYNPSGSFRTRISNLSWKCKIWEKNPQLTHLSMDYSENFGIHPSHRAEQFYLQPDFS